MKQSKTSRRMGRMLSVLLALLMLLGSLPMGALAEDFIDASEFVTSDESWPPTYTTPEMEALIAAFNENIEQEMLLEDLVVKGMKYLAGKVGGKIEDTAWNTVWKTLLGGDDNNNNQEILEALARIEGQLQKIMDLLQDMLKEQRLQKYEKSIQDKLDLTRKIINMLNNRTFEFDNASTIDGKYKVLDEWFERTHVGEQSNALDSFTYYVNYVTNTDNMNMYGDFFGQYDLYAHIKWDWDIDGLPFRSLQRQRDITLVMKMAVMNTMYLAKERVQHPEKNELTEAREKILRKSMEQFISYYEKHTTGDPEITNYHGQGVNFDIYIGQAKQLEGYRGVNNGLVRNSNPYSLTQRTHAVLNEVRPQNPGMGDFKVISFQQAEVLWKLGKEEGNLSLAGVLKKHTGAKMADNLKLVASRDEYFNTPFHVVLIVNEKWCQIRYEYLDATSTNMNHQDSVAACAYGTSVMIPIFVPAPDPGRYEVIRKSDDRTEYFENTKLDMIWTRDHGKAGGTEDDGGLPDVSEQTNAAWYYGAEDGYALICDSDGYLLRMRDEGAAYVALDGSPVDDPQTLVGQQVMAHYHMDIDWENPGFTFAEGGKAPAGGEIPVVYTVDGPMTLLSVTQLDDAERKTAGGVLQSIDVDGMPGGDGSPVIHLEALPQADGAEEAPRDFTLPDGLPEGLLVGSDVLVTYHLQGALAVADHVEVVRLPEPEPEQDLVAEGVVTGIHPEEEILGGLPTMTLALPGGELTFRVPLPLLSGVEVGAQVQVLYFTGADYNVAQRVYILDGPAPEPVQALEIEGQVLHIDTISEILGLPPTVIVAAPGGNTSIQAPDGLPGDIGEGAMVAVRYHVADGANVAEDIQVLSLPPAPEPDDPVEPDDPFDPVPNPSPDDPVDPVPAPLDMWAEGYVMDVADDPAQMMPGQRRSLTVSAAGQVYTLSIPADMVLGGDVQVGAFVHVDFMRWDGEDVAYLILVLEPVWEEPIDPVPNPMPDDDGPFDPVVNPMGDDD